MSLVVLVIFLLTEEFWATELLQAYIQDFWLINFLSGLIKVYAKISCFAHRKPLTTWTAFQESFVKV